jgi:hypothetical protein
MERSAVPFVLLLQKTSLEFRHKFRDHIMRVVRIAATAAGRHLRPPPTATLYETPAAPPPQ